MITVSKDSTADASVISVFSKERQTSASESGGDDFARLSNPASQPVSECAKTLECFSRSGWILNWHFIKLFDCQGHLHCVNRIETQSTGPKQRHVFGNFRRLDLEHAILDE